MGKGQKTRVSGKEQYKGGNYSAGRRPDLTSGKSEGLADFRGKFVSHDPRHGSSQPFCFIASFTCYTYTPECPGSVSWISIMNKSCAILRTMYCICTGCQATHTGRVSHDVVVLPLMSKRSDGQESSLRATSYAMLRNGVNRSWLTCEKKGDDCD